MSEEHQISGRCLCGAVTIVLRNPVGWVGACHCRMCQRWSGSVWAGFPAAPDNVTVEGPVRRYQSSVLAERAFCESCGSHLWMRDHEPGAAYDLMPGLFEEAKDWPLKSEVYADEAMAAMRLEGDHPKASATEYRAKNPKTDKIGSNDSAREYPRQTAQNTTATFAPEQGNAK